MGSYYEGYEEWVKRMSRGIRELNDLRDFATLVQWTSHMEGDIEE